MEREYTILEMFKNQKAYYKSLLNRWKYAVRLINLIKSTAPKETVVVMIITICIGLLPLLSIFALQHLVNSVTLLENNSSYEVLVEIILWVVLFIFALILQSTGRIFGGMIQEHIQERIKASIQRLVIRKSHKLSLGQFENAELYDQLQRANNGLDNRLFSTISFMFESIANVITLVSLLIYLLFSHWALPLVLFIGSIVFTLFQVKLFTEKYILHRKQTTEMRKLNYFERLMTSREAAAEIRLFGLSNHLTGTWNNLNQKLRKERIELARREYNLKFISASGNTMTFGVVLTGIVYLATLGLLSVGQYAAFLRAIMQFQDVLTTLLIDIAIINNDLRYVKDFFEYLDLTEEKITGIPLLDERLKEGIICENISFTYPGSSMPVLNNINFKIQPGERIALVGNNGSGKSTLIKLLLGLYQPTEGRIVVEGEDLKDVNQLTWRKKCTAIFQDFQKYHLPIKDNIAVGQIDKIDDYDEITKASILSGADDMINEMPKGYNTFLGKEFGGLDISQGQWQKIAVARAYFRNSDILILDEPTASLDPKAEVAIYKNFQEVAKDRTTIMISHRLGVAKLADRIVVLNNGSIAEQGTHDTLMEKNGYYAKMYRLQSQWYS